MDAEVALAKINLCLHVTGRRPDGYHLLETMVIFADVGERLEAEAAPDEQDHLLINGSFANAIGSSRSNAALGALRLLREMTGAEERLAVRLVKEIPVSGGLGGGTADAAAMLRLLKRRWNIEWPVKEWSKLAAMLGADVPMCSLSRPLWALGIGETLEILKPMPSLWLVLANPGVAVATPDVFAAYQSPLREPMNRPSGFTDTRELCHFLAKTANDLQNAAITLAPSIGETLRALEDAKGCLLARMSGSGATCFGIFESEEAAARAALELETHHPLWWVKTVRSEVSL
ncbi:MAG: 4-(cytidine 5'-diphospho)-2-C-methyl-D-erythritol kinase [Alphaproteobacteria bacterium]|nr:4-(cytidine 5'-diphospho)-2-C-methyl-D-erythritol kinase [Alphaproteobacteria bacterium]